MSDFEFTRHAQVRMQQRSFSPEDIEMIVRHGENYGCRGYVLTNKATDREIRRLKREIGQLERLRNRKVVLDGSEVVTCYRVNKRTWKRKNITTQG